MHTIIKARQLLDERGLKRCFRTLKLGGFGGRLARQELLVEKNAYGKCASRNEQNHRRKENELR